MSENLARLLSIFVGFRFSGIGFAVEIDLITLFNCFARLTAYTLKTGAYKFSHVLFCFYFLQVVRHAVQTVFDRITYFK